VEEVTGVRVLVNDALYELDSTVQEANELITSVKADYPGLPAEADVMIESILTDFCQEHGNVTDAVSIEPISPVSEGGRYSFIQE
jgi:hypothetical protein